jgi:hypothetical protein
MHNSAAAARKGTALLQLQPCGADGRNLHAPVRVHGVGVGGGDGAWVGPGLDPHRFNLQG